MWQEKNGKLYKKYNFKTFSEAINFMSVAADRIDNLHHHPEWKNVYNEVEVWLVTHRDNSITDKDHQLADALDDIYSRFNPEDDKDRKGDKKNSETYGMVKLYTDGGSRGNPGPSAIGFVLYDIDDKEITKDSKYIGLTTNNQAEYQGLKEGLEVCLSMNVHEVDIYMDSLLVVNQMKGIYKIKNRDLWPIYEAIREILKHFNKVSFNHIPRELNKVADSMVNDCLDKATE